MTLATGYDLHPGAAPNFQSCHKVSIMLPQKKGVMTGDTKGE